MAQEPSADIKFAIWQRHLTLVYGTEAAAQEDLFLRHTYLATLAKLLAACIFARPTSPSVEGVLGGTYFAGLGVHNFVEDDLFTWPLHPLVRDAFVPLARRLFAQLQSFDPHGFTEDVLKGLYESLVDPQERHDLGEYYTPDWLAHRMIRYTLEAQPTARLLDPACGSGTFLFTALRFIKDVLGSQGWSPQQILDHVQNNVFGIDIHPLAVLIARTNYLVALADLLPQRQGPFTLPVYLGDSLQFLQGTVAGGLANALQIRVWEQPLWFPEVLAMSPERFDRVIDHLIQAAHNPPSDAFSSALQSENLSPDQISLLQRTLGQLRTLFSQGRDSVWRFILRNLVRPAILERGEPFDLVIGNPPWLAFQFIQRQDFQDFVRERMRDLSIYPRGPQLVPHLELAALFFADASLRYLRPGGRIAFVMPRASLVARQYAAFLRFQFRDISVRLEEVWDLESVEPLFNVPACVLVATSSLSE